jgi:hypothetical protein
MALRLTPAMVERFWSRVDRRGGPDACWLCHGRVSLRGIGWYSVMARQLAPHRIAFHLAGGTVPAGQVLYRRCRNRLCCNPAHLQPMTKAELARVRSRR